MDSILVFDPITRETMPSTTYPSPGPGRSDTRDASSEVLAERPRSLPSSEFSVGSIEVAIPIRPPLPSLGPLETSGQAGTFQEAPPSLSTTLPSPRNGRSQSLAQQSAAGFAHAPIRRKPLSRTASPLATKFPSQNYLEIVARSKQQPDQRFSRAFSVDSPTLYEFQEVVVGSLSSSLASSMHTSSPRPSQLSFSPISQESCESEENPGAGADNKEDSRNIPHTHPAAAQTALAGSPQEEVLSAPDSVTQESDSTQSAHFWPEPPVARNINNSNAMSLSTRKQAPPHLTLGQADTGVHTTTTTKKTTTSGLDVPDTKPDNFNKPLPSSPGTDPNTFFGWGYSPSTTEFSEDDKDGYSPLPSPTSTKPTTAFTFTDEYPGTSRTLTIPGSNASNQNALDLCEAYLHTPSISATPPPGQIEEMEDELKAISAELAASIRREMDLEDLVERLQDQVNNSQNSGKRTSDYYSDSGYSSAKFSDYDQAKEEMTQVARRAEQEKAQIRLELTDKLQLERSRRRDLDVQIQELSMRASQFDAAQMRDKDVSGRVKELEMQCEDLRRKVSEERQFKENFEDLLKALKDELQTAANERDNLRDEVVPSLKAQVEGLEGEAADQAKMAYDASKMQQELEALKSENDELKQSVESGSRKSITLARSASIAGGSYKKNRPPSLARSNTVKQAEPREVLAERLKDVEAQRDALHSALKNLLDRQEFQNRENEKKIKALEQERERLLTASPKKAGYEKEITGLRDEINTLRRRAEEAIEQKWRVEKGLVGLKMDLDRAEEEITSLRRLLKEKDILIPDSIARASGSSDRTAIPVTSESLEKAYKDLQDAYTEALERIKALESTSSSDDKTKLAIERLEQALATAVSERDFARAEATSLQTKVDAMQASTQTHLGAERDLADQLRESARRVEELAQQVRAQLGINKTLRDRLTDAVTRGETDQRESKERIASMQNRLHSLEMQLVATQTAAEERVQRHEEELANIKEAHNGQLQRLRDASGGLRSPRLFPPKTPLSPMFANGPRTPRMIPVRPSSSGSAHLSPGSARDRSSVHSNRSSSQPPSAAAGNAQQVATLRARVAELEGALASADAEMQEVVARMSAAQIEVLTLQEQREEAVRETRRLQRLMEAEKVRAFEDRFRSITTEVR